MFQKPIPSPLIQFSVSLCLPPFSLCHFPLGAYSLHRHSLAHRQNRAVRGTEEKVSEGSVEAGGWG